MRMKTLATRYATTYARAADYETQLKAEFPEAIIRVSKPKYAPFGTMIKIIAYKKPIKNKP